MNLNNHLSQTFSLLKYSKNYNEIKNQDIHFSMQLRISCSKDFNRQQHAKKKGKENLI